MNPLFGLRPNSSLKNLPSSRTLLLAVWILLRSLDSEAAVQVGFLMSHQGRVTVDGTSVSKALPLYEGVKVETGANGQCTLMVGRDIILHLSPQTSLLIAKAEIQRRRAEFQLGHGKIRALVRSTESSFRPREYQGVDVRSRAVTLGVRGTQFTVEAPLEQTLPQKFVALEGQVQLSLPGSGDLSSRSDLGDPRRVQSVTLEKGQAFVMQGAVAPGAVPSGPSSSFLISPRGEPQVTTLKPAELALEFQSAAAAPRPILTAGQFQEWVSRPNEDFQPGSTAGRPTEVADSEGKGWSDSIWAGSPGTPGGGVFPLDPVLDGDSSQADGAARVRMSVVVGKQD